MATKTTEPKVECLNPETGHRMNISKSTYELFSKAIYHVLKGSKPLSFSEIEEGVYDCFKKQKTDFKGSVGWYTVTVKKDMESRNVIESYMEKGRKLHRLKKG